MAQPVDRAMVMLRCGYVGIARRRTGASCSFVAAQLNQLGAAPRRSSLPAHRYTPAMSLLVTGTIGIDTVHTPTGSVEGVMGGSCAYFAIAASYFGRVRLVAVVGGDWPDEHRRALQAIDNISLEGLEVRPGGRTFAWGGRYLENMNERETLFTELGVLADDPPIVPQAYLDSRFVFLGNTHPVEQLRMLDQCPVGAFTVADTMNLWIDTAHGELMDLLGRIDGLVLNDSEATQLTGVNNAVTAGRRILKFGPSFAVIKKGEHGCVLVHADGVAALPAYPAEAECVVDPTGAGDSFAGGMMGHIAATGRTDFATIQASLAWGTVIASFTIESFSLDRLARLTRAEIDQRMSMFKEMTQVG
jgi:sugar/nucleoside kinase (ribokinase family)